MPELLAAVSRTLDTQSAAAVGVDVSLDVFAGMLCGPLLRNITLVILPIYMLRLVLPALAGRTVAVELPRLYNADVKLAFFVMRVVLRCECLCSSWRLSTMSLLELLVLAILEQAALRYHVWRRIFMTPLLDLLACSSRLFVGTFRNSVIFPGVLNPPKVVVSVGYENVDSSVRKTRQKW